MNGKSRTWAEIDLNAALHNFQLAQKLTGGKPVMPVIKGDAHGHGAGVLGRFLEKHGAAAFAVACLSEAVELREAGITVPVLILGYTDPSEAGELLRCRITQSVFDSGYGKELSREVMRLTDCTGTGETGFTGNRLCVHAKVDTGMTRTGFYAQKDAAAAAAEIAALGQLPGLSLTGIFTHYAAADVPEKESFTAWQLENFKAVLKELKRTGTDPERLTIHASNSAVILYHPESYFDMVRMGVMLYGMYPSDDYANRGELEPVLTLKTRVAQVKHVEKGAEVSYGCTYTAPREMDIAVAAAGYADSYPRALSGKGAWAVIGGSRCAQIGRICMDMCMFDVTGKDVKEGDEVILYGKGGMSHELTARLAGSINCEHTCLLTKRVEKVYLGGGSQD